MAICFVSRSTPSQAPQEWSDWQVRVPLAQVTQLSI
jgi:hypothetical protein